MKFCIKGIIKAFDLPDLKIMSEYYFEKILKIDPSGIGVYDTGFLHTRFKAFHSQIEERMLLRGIIALITGTYPEFGFEYFYIVDENDMLISSGFPQHLCIPPRSNLECMHHYKINATEIYINAFENLSLKWVLVLFSQRMDDLPFIGWANLYSIYEIIGKDIQVKTQKTMGSYAKRVGK